MLVHAVTKIGSILHSEIGSIKSIPKNHKDTKHYNSWSYMKRSQAYSTLTVSHVKNNNNNIDEIFHHIHVKMRVKMVQNDILCWETREAGVNKQNCMQISTTQCTYMI